MTVTFCHDNGKFRAVGAKSLQSFGVKLPHDGHIPVDFATGMA